MTDANANFQARIVKPFSYLPMTEPEDIARIQAENRCSLSPDAIGGKRFSTICLEHDLAYARGGEWRDRLRADRVFYGRFRRALGDKWWGGIVAGAYFVGVRVGGRFFFKVLAMAMR